MICKGNSICIDKCAPRFCKAHYDGQRLSSRNIYVATELRKRLFLVFHVLPSYDYIIHLAKRAALGLPQSSTLKRRTQITSIIPVQTIIALIFIRSLVRRTQTM